MSKYKVSASILELSAALVDRFNQLGMGIELSEFSLPKNLEDEVLEDGILRAQKILKGLNGPLSLHGAFFNLQIMARDPWIVEVCYKRMFQSLSLAELLGADKVVFHANYFPHHASGHKQRFINAHLNYWPQLVEKAEELQIEILIENTQEPDPSYIKAILDGLDSPWVNTCLDTGHMHCFTDSNVPLEEWVKGYGNKLTYIHLHANHGKSDEHLAFTDGNQDFSKFFEAIDALERPPHIIIEVKTKEAFERSVTALQEMGIL